ncbi:hypothetical protein DAI22_04g187300 [Oryza sativa Japonica Group]|nr:hypothetical protein DAI22_04g187300 [Oryza sativa Japonica Group]
MGGGRVRFNVGGQVFETTTTTLANAGRESMLGALLDSSWNLAPTAGAAGEAALQGSALLRPPRPRPRRAVGRVRRRPPPPRGVGARAGARGRHGHPRRARRGVLRRARGRRARLQLDARRAPPGVARPLAGQRRGVPRRGHAPDRRARAPGEVRRRDGRVLRRLRGPAAPLPRRARPPGQVLHRRRAGVRPGLEHLRQLQGQAQRVRHRRLGPRHRRAGRLLLRAAWLRLGRRRQAPMAGRHQRAHGGDPVPQDRQLFHRPARFPGQERGLVVVRRRHGRVARRQARAPRHRHGGRAVRLRDQPVRRPRVPRPEEQRRRRAVELPEQVHEPEGAQRGELLPEARHARRAALLVDERQHLRLQWPRVRPDVHAAEEPRRRHLRLLHRRRSPLRPAQRGECVRRLGDAAAADHLTAHQWTTVCSLLKVHRDASRVAGVCVRCCSVKIIVR